MSAPARPYTPPTAPRQLPDGRRVGEAAQPVSTVTWVPRDDLKPNGWNPNRHATPELVLLAVSIIEDGWTQPIVTRPDLTIVDGFHRWTVSGWPKVAALTGGHVPVVTLNADTDEAQQRMATIRHNRARGNHYVLSMADLAQELVDLGVGPDDMARRLGMEPEEVRRLLDRGDMTKRASAGQFNKGWSPTMKETPGAPG